LKPGVAEAESDAEEDDADDDGHDRDESNDVVDLDGQRRLGDVEAAGQAGNPAHDGVVADADDDALGGALEGVGGEESQVFGLEWVLVGTFWGQCYKTFLLGANPIKLLTAVIS